MMLLTVLVGYILFHIGGAAIQEIPKKNKRDNDWDKQGAKLKKISAIVLLVATSALCILASVNGNADISAFRMIQLYVAIAGIVIMLVGFMIGGLLSMFKKTLPVAGVSLWIAFMTFDALKWVAAASLICALFE